ncbi:MAG: hypothetical protein HY720_02840 [Planctomycetes bacterium]|nr:hypothetical protein [Planctomycetota bacterium]
MFEGLRTSRLGCVAFLLACAAAPAARADDKPEVHRDVPFLQWVREDAAPPEDLDLSPRLSDERAGERWEVRDGRLWLAAAGDAPYAVLDLSEAPWPEVTAIAAAGGGAVRCGTERGAFLWDGSGCRYFASRRWLPDDRVTGIAVREGRAWIATRGGTTSILARPMTLAEKAAHFERTVRERHVRFGLVSSCGLDRPGDLASFRLHDSDNDGLWTGMYVAAESFRFAATGDPEARRFARESLEALFRLERITGIPGFPARSFTRLGEHGGGEWHPTPDGEWEWKGDTSSDEIAGHLYAFHVYHELVATNEEKQEIAAVVGRILGHILEHDLALADLDGEPTTWGRWSKQHYGLAAWLFARGLQSLEILSHLAVARRMTGEERFGAAYLELVRRGYARNVPSQKIEFPTAINHSDDELAFLSFYPLLDVEKDPELLAIYRRALERSWKVERPEGNALWNFIYAAGMGKRTGFDLASAILTLQDQPLDLVEWGVENSHRNDVEVSPVLDRHRRIQGVRVLPPSERPLHKHNGNPYQLDSGGGGRGEEAATFWLLPYWMGRHHGYIREP